MLYKCSSCGKENEVAFRVVTRTPEKISRATPDTPKPLCLLCAEKKRDRILAELKNPKVKPKKPKVKQKVKQGSGDESIPLTWRWDAYGRAWTKRRPSKPGHYWVSSGRDNAPKLVAVKDPLEADFILSLAGDDVWYLGPIRVPLCPSMSGKEHKELEQAKAKKPVEQIKLETAKIAPRTPAPVSPPPAAVPAMPEPAGGKRMLDLEEQIRKRKTPFVKSFAEKAQEIIGAQEEELASEAPQGKMPSKEEPENAQHPNA